MVASARSVFLLEVGRRLVVRAPETAGTLAVGGSVCVSGTCLSAVEIGEDWFATDMSEETAHRTTLADHSVGAGVNLELPLRIGDSLDGHLVQGHTDAVGKVTAIDDSRRWATGMDPSPAAIHGRGGGQGLCRRGRSELDRGGAAPGPLLGGAHPDHPARDHPRIAPGRRPGQSGVRSVRQVGPRAARGGPPGSEQVICRPALGRGAAWRRRGREDRGPARRRRGGDHPRPGPGSRGRRRVRRRRPASRVVRVPVHPGLWAYDRAL